MCSQTEYFGKSTCMHIIHREYARTMHCTCMKYICTIHGIRMKYTGAMHGICMKYVCTMHGTRMKYTSAMHKICLYHAWNYAWYMHEDLGKMHACFRPVPCLSSTCKCPKSLHVSGAPFRVGLEQSSSQYKTLMFY